VEWCAGTALVEITLLRADINMITLVEITLLRADINDHTCRDHILRADINMITLDEITLLRADIKTMDRVTSFGPLQCQPHHTSFQLLGVVVLVACSMVCFET
jgi:hypothetical protein